MGETHVTLKDIAQSTGYSLASVHRAIYNKEGLSEKARERILDAVKSMGYEVNYMASSLKRKTLNIAYVGKHPEIEKDYHHMMAEGVKSAFSQDEGMNISLEMIYFKGKPHELQEEECRILEKIYHRNDLDGIVIMPINTGIELRLAIQKIIARGCPVILVDDSFEQMDYLCAVEPHNNLVGRTGAEFLNHSCDAGRILVALGCTSSAGQMENFKGFSTYMKENNPALEVVAVTEPFDEGKLVQELVSRIDDTVVALYTVCESNTPAICNAAILSGREDLKVLGCDLRPENREYLKQGVLCGILDMNSYMQGFLAMRLLIEFLLKNNPPNASEVFVPVNLVLQNSLPFLEGERSAGIPIIVRLPED